MEEDIRKSLEVLKNGGVILYPTDTIWGLGCDAANEKAVARIFEIKRRSDSKSLIILVDNDMRLTGCIREVPEQAWQLIEYSEQPLTLVLPGARNLAPNVVAADGSVGIRITKDIFCKKLIERFRRPIVSTSANISGKHPPAFFGEIDDEIRRGADYVVSYKQDDNTPKTPSTIIKLGLKGEIEFLRK